MTPESLTVNPRPDCPLVIAAHLPYPLIMEDRSSSICRSTRLSTGIKSGRLGSPPKLGQHREALRLIT